MSRHMLSVPRGPRLILNLAILGFHEDEGDLRGIDSHAIIRVSRVSWKINRRGPRATVATTASVFARSRV